MSHRASAVAVGRPLLLLAGLLLIASNLRAPITGVAPLVETLQAVFSLSPAEAGLLTTLPLLAFGIVSPFTALFARRLGLERTLFAALLLIGGGIVLRSAGTVWGLYLGTAIIGVGIAVGNVLLPSLVKRDFPGRVAGVTGGCALTMGIASALASACVVPLADGLGWQLALGAAMLWPLLAALLWSGQLQSRAGLPRVTAAVQGGPVWRSALAWQVTLFMGINSLLYYVLVAWLPAILTAAGTSPTVAGSLHGVMQLASALPGLLLGPIISRMRDQRLVAAGMGLLMGVALFGLAWAPDWATLWAFCIGLGSGGGLLLALIFMGLRTGSVPQAAALSGMAQCVGYLLAACGPALAGKLHGLTGSWTVTLYLGVLLSGVMLCFGLLAGRSRIIGEPAH